MSSKTVKRFNEYVGVEAAKRAAIRKGRSREFAQCYADVVGLSV